MPIIIERVSQFQAEEELKKRGILFDRTFELYPKEHQTAYGYALKGHQRPIHVYFMVHNSDVAYYTPDMNTLFIHDKPRQWS